ncbi:hypothetical protein BCR35DRAFT_310774 [Leucosporidium creatinivorum]|uniref:Ricin B lectin domain-containing protein n=1 Tax=Leucosporidium creatinivorum TaxID=106004 RepID=A0A1Y2CS90_9BASI|nr:hypothetical protein BCR35DRAFT_310774 [Leucosporidium creatinivorum]
MVFIQAALSLGAFAGLASAGGIVHMTSTIQPIIDTASTLEGSGNYVLENAATGQVLAFSREGGTTNFYPGDAGDSIEIQFDGNAARLSGGNNKCASAQWSYDVEGGVDHAAVSYACAVGSGQSGTASLEKTKQWWYFIPADGSSSDDNSGDDNSSSSSSTTEAPAPSTTTTQAAAPSTTEASSSSSSDDSVATPASGRSARVLLSSESTSSSSDSSSSSSSLLTKPKGYYETESSTISLDQVDVSSVVKSDRTTWICRHPGWWLNNHPAYVTAAGHVECASDLKAYRAANKRSKRSHHDLAKTLSKRGGQQFYILTQDHIYDMATRAVAGSSLSTYGGYTSTTLALWDKSDKSQIWTVNSA